eukprot:m.133948 g.133948  ORF g.133948 m.133948 type:complete len:67 (+) comp9509_c2_seq1:133-333(+)
MAPKLLSSLFGAKPPRAGSKDKLNQAKDKDADSDDEQPARLITVEGDKEDRFKVSGNGHSDAWCMY